MPPCGGSGLGCSWGEGAGTTARSIELGNRNAGMFSNMASMGPALIEELTTLGLASPPTRGQPDLANDCVGGPDWYSEANFAIRMNAALHFGAFSILDCSAFWHVHASWRVTCITRCDVTCITGSIGNGR
jgi:hypothetical protein